VERREGEGGKEGEGNGLLLIDPHTYTHVFGNNSEELRGRLGRREG